jgi:hypothetical protein
MYHNRSVTDVLNYFFESSTLKELSLKREYYADKKEDGDSASKQYFFINTRVSSNYSIRPTKKSLIGRSPTIGEVNIAICIYISTVTLRIA